MKRFMKKMPLNISGNSEGATLPEFDLVQIESMEDFKQFDEDLANKACYNSMVSFYLFIC